MPKELTTAITDIRIVPSKAKDEITFVINVFFDSDPESFRCVLDTPEDWNTAARWSIIHVTGVNRNKPVDYVREEIIRGSTGNFMELVYAQALIKCIRLAIKAIESRIEGRKILAEHKARTEAIAAHEKANEQPGE